ncbi:MAG: tetratricopeptide repeat protein, partial [Acidimicrobiales bacterium]
MSATGVQSGRDTFLVQGGLHVVASEPPVERLPVFEVPLADRRWFWGRADLLDALDAAWRDQATVALTQILAGLGGVGKSQLAAQFAYRHRDELDVVWWVSCTSPPGGELDARALVRTRLGSLGAFLGLPPSDDPEDRAAAVRRWLETTIRRWLVVFDDAPEWSVLEGLVPQGGRGLCLITSRNPHWDLADQVLDVGVFEPDTAAAFLQARAGIEDPDGARALAEAVGGLALALEQAGAFVAHSPVPLGFDGYLQALRSRGLRVFAHGRVDDYDHVVTTVWEQSFAAVAAASPDAAAVLELLAVLAPAPIPISVLNPNEAGRVGTAAALAELRRYSLVTSGSGEIVVHQLVHAAMNERLSPERRGEARRLAVEQLSSAFPDDPSDPASWPAATALTPHVLALHVAGTDDFDLLELVAAAGRSLRAQGDYAAARRLQEEVLAAWREVLGERHPDTLTAANNLAGTLQAQGDYAAARTLQEEVLAARREVLGERHPDTLTAANNLAMTLHAQGDYAAARTLQEEV